MADSASPDLGGGDTFAVICDIPYGDPQDRPLKAAKVASARNRRVINPASRHTASARNSAAKLTNTPRRFAVAGPGASVISAVINRTERIQGVEWVSWPQCIQDRIVASHADPHGSFADRCEPFKINFRIASESLQYGARLG
jgi:hypothetical protein